MPDELDELLEVYMFLGYINEHHVPCANLPYTIAEEACERMLQRNPEVPFAATWSTRNDGQMVFFLKSRGEFNVGALALIYNGEGTPEDAGFVTPVWPVMLLPA